MAEPFMVDLDLIDEDPDNPRGDVGPVTALKLSIAQDGQLEPLQLIAQGNGRWSIFEGHRRDKALRELGRTQAEAIEKRFTSDTDRVVAQGAIHLHRRNWDAMAWARYLHRLWDPQGPHNLDRDALARRLGISQGFVRDHLSFMHLLDYEQRALERGELTRKEALARLAKRRAERDGTPPPAKAKKTTTKKTPASTPSPAAVPVRSADDPYLNHAHRLAEDVADRCAMHHHTDRPKIGGVGCGQAWEEAIRADVLAGIHPALAAA